MVTYFIRRLLLVPVTFVCITFMVYTIIRSAPGGPIEQAQMQMRASAAEGGGGAGGMTDTGDMAMPQEAIDQLKVYYKLDKSIPVAYGIWLGVWPDDVKTALYGELSFVSGSATVKGKQTSFTDQVEPGDVIHVGDELLEVEAVVNNTELILTAPATKTAAIPKPERERTKFRGVLQGDLGVSYRYSDPVIDTIIARFPVSIYFGLIGYFSTWIVCIPLGVYKALKHRSLFDTGTSMAVFLGYSIPGFVACLIMLMLFATDLLSGDYPIIGEVSLDIFPLGRFRSEGWDDWWAAGEYWRCITDQLYHTAIPVTGYVLGGFATMTILMKNSLLENLGADYVRTAYAKGLSEKRVVFLHALRNSLIPICVGVGHAIGLLLAGSFLIEKTCNIQGIGLLGFDSILERDFPVIMGILVIAVSARLIGNILSDFALAAVDPRVRFG